MTDYYIGVDPGGSPGIAALRIEDGKPVLIGTHTMRDWGPSNDWEPGAMWVTIYARSALWDLAVRQLESSVVPVAVIESQWSWGRREKKATTATKSVLAYAILSCWVAERVTSEWLVTPPRQWQAYFRKFLQNRDVEPPEKTKDLTKLIVDRFFPNAGRMNKDVRAAVCLALYGWLTDKEKEADGERRRIKELSKHVVG